MCEIRGCKLSTRSHFSSSYTKNEHNKLGSYLHVIFLNYSTLAIHLDHLLDYLEEIPPSESCASAQLQEMNANLKEQDYFVQFDVRQIFKNIVWKMNVPVLLSFFYIGRY